MKQNLLKALSIFIVVVTSVLFSSSQSTAAILQMKKGQKVEGEYIGGSKNEVHIAVGSQILKFNVEEIDAIIFNASTNLSFQNSPKDDFSKAAREVLRVLKGLAAVTEAGVNYEKYSPRVLDAAVKINEFIEEHKDFNPEFKQHISDALGYYNAASSAWNATITQSESRFNVESDPYLKKCKTLYNMVQTAHDELKKGGHLKGDGLLRMTVHAGSSAGLSALWSCAKSEIDEAEALLKKEINADGGKSETPKVNKGESKSTDNKVEEIKNTNQAGTTANDKRIKEINATGGKSETPKANKGENKLTDNKVEETKNSNQAGVTANDGLLKVDNIESRVTDKQNPILVEWNKWVNRPKFQVLTTDLKSRVIEEYVKYIYSSSTTDQGKTDSLVSILKNYEGIDTSTTKKP